MNTRLFETLEQYKKLLSQNKLTINNLNEVETLFMPFIKMRDIKLRTEILRFIYNFYIKFKVFEKIEYICEEFYFNLKKIQDYRAIAAMYFSYGNYKRMIGKHDEAEKLINKSIRLCKKINYENVCIRFGALANIYIEKTEYNKALEFYYQALETAKLEKKDADYFAIKYNLAILYFELKFNDRSYKLFSEDFHELKKKKDYAQCAANLNMISTILLADNKLLKAQKYCDRSYRYYMRGKDHIGVWRTYITHGNILSAKGNHAEALICYKEAQLRLEKMNYKSELITLYRSFGEVYIHLNKLNQSIVFLEKAEEISNSLNQRFELKKIYSALHVAYNLANRKSDAYTVLNKLNDINEIIFKFSIDSRVQGLQRLHDADTKELTYKKELEISNYRLQSLQNQMNPHFIFNSMGTIQNLILNNDVEHAINFVSDFGLLMRSMLDNFRHDLVTLQDELDFIKKYVQLESIRYQDSFDCIYTIELKASEIAKIKIPTMLIQPLIENAIKHGISQIRNQKGILNIHIRKQDEDYLEIKIVDNGNSNHKNKPKSTHKSAALHIIIERLKLYSIKGNFGEFEFKNLGNGGESKLILPIQ